MLYQWSYVPALQNGFKVSIEHQVALSFISVNDIHSFTAFFSSLTRYLVKCCKFLQEGEQLPSLMRYLQRPPGGSSRLNTQLDLADLVDAYEHRAGR